MTMNYGSKDTRDERVKGRRHDAILTVGVWLKARPYLPADLRRALLFLLPELNEKDEDFSQSDADD